MKHALNPVPVLINKALIEIPPKFAGRSPVNPEARAEGAATKGKGKKQKTLIEKQWHGASGLAEDVRYYGQWMRDEAEKRIGHLYPKVKITNAMAKHRSDLEPYVGEELTVIAWFWARTVASPDPAVRGGHVPLVKSFWLSKRKGKQAWIEPVINKTENSCSFIVGQGDDGPQVTGTVNRKGGRCLISGTPIPFDYIRNEGKHGRLRFVLMGIAAEGRHGRVYLSPIEEHARIAQTAKPSWVPDAELANNPFSLRPPLYGLNRFSDLFTMRQLTVLSMLSGLLSDVHTKIVADANKSRLPNKTDLRGLAAKGIGPISYADSIITYLAFALDKLVDLTNTGCLWEPVAQCPRNLFGRQALPMHWNFAEANAFGNSSGSFAVVLENATRNLTAVLALSDTCIEGCVSQEDAAELSTANPPPMICTDPPYYNNIDYADLSDFFYVWLRRSLGIVFGDIVKTVLTPKSAELVATPYRFNGSKEAAKTFFEKGLSKVFVRLHAVHDPSLPLTVFYAFKQSEDVGENGDSGDDEERQSDGQVSTGWETMLEALIASGLGITGTWPMRTELTSALKEQMNALASSIVLVCCPRPANASLATRKDFITALRRELPEALRKLQRGNIAPVDLAQAAIGPGMAVFTRYAKVIESDGSAMTVRTALGIINQVLDEVLAEQEGDFDPDTRWALAWFEQFGMAEGPYGVAETLSKAKNTAVKGLEEAGVVKAGKSKVQLLGRSNLPDDWDPATDNRLTVWETAQYLIRTLETKGETEAATLLNKLGGIGETARELAYRLFSICERKKWADEALAYNSLVIAWPELSKLALSSRNRQSSTQQDLFT